MTYIITPKETLHSARVSLCSIWFSEQELCPYTELIHWFFMTKTM